MCKGVHGVAFQISGACTADFARSDIVRPDAASRIAFASRDAIPFYRIRRHALHRSDRHQGRESSGSPGTGSSHCRCRPAFISVGGDIAYNGDDANDWKVWDSETEIWRQRHIAVYPALGNHDLHGDRTVALANYFQRFPALENNRYYSVRAANTLMLVLDSSLDETSGPQGDWLAKKLDSVTSDVDFVFLVLHHPPYTASSDRVLGGGHSARHPEHLLAQMLEERQGRTHARFVVFSGHVHNYERQEHNGVTYFVTGGGGARPYPIERTPDDPLNGKIVNYHYLLVEVDRGNLKITMHRLDLTSGTAVDAT